MMGHIPSFQDAREQKELTEEQEAYLEQFIQERTAAGYATPVRAEAEAEAEEHLRLTYQVAGLEPPHIRWFDSPLAFVLEPEPAPQSIETRLRTSLEASIAATIPERISEPVWVGLSYMIERIGTNVWYSTGRLIEKEVQERMGRATRDMADAPRFLTRRDLATALWSVATEGLWQADNDNALRLGFRVADSAQAYENQAGLALLLFLAQVFEPHDLIHLIHFNDLVCGYRLGRTEAWLVRKPVHVARDQQGYLHAEDGMCLRYRDGWGFYAWHGCRVPEKVLLHPERVTPEDWLPQNDLQVRQAIQERLGHRKFAEMMGGLRVEKGQVVVDLGNGPEQTGYQIHLQDGSPRVCAYPRAIFELYCQQHCSQARPCPLFSDLQLF
jgi:hypothetical protein